MTADRLALPSKDFEDRLCARFEAMGVRLEQLYPGQGVEVLARVAHVLRRADAARPSELRQLDRRRLVDPDWFLTSDRIGYSCYADRFAGRLADIPQRLSHLKQLGVSYLHLLPILKMRPGADDGGFAVSDYGAVDPRLGDMDDLRDLAGRLRADGVSLCIDFTLNHTSDDHPWAKAAREGDMTARSYYHVISSAGEVATLETHLAQVFPETAPGNFTRIDELDGWVWTTFYPFQWDLNYANPDVLCEMLSALLHLANAGVEVFRLDSTPFLWKRAGTDCRNLPETHLLVQVLRLAVETAAPGVLLKAEAVVEPKNAAAYLGDPARDVAEAHLAYNNSLMVHLWAALAEGDAEPIRDLTRLYCSAPGGAGWINYLRCHDDIGWSVLVGADGAPSPDQSRRLAAFYRGDSPGSFARGADFQARANGAAPATCGMLASLAGLEAAAGDAQATESAIARIRLLHGLIASLPGMPMIYMGDEIGLLNDWDYLQRDRFFEDARGLNRPFMDWALADRVAERDLPAARIFRDLAHLLGVRRRSPALASGADCRVVETSVPQVLLVERTSAVDRVCVIANLSDQPVRLDMVDLPRTRSGWRDRLDKSSVPPREGIDLAPYALHWLEEAN